MVSVCLPSDALLQHLPSYLGFSYLGRGVSLHSSSSKAQPLLLTLDEGYLLTTALPDLQRGIAPLGLPVPMQPPVLGCGGCESEWTLGVGDGQEGLACCNSWGRKESDTTERLNWTELNAVLSLILWKRIRKLIWFLTSGICMKIFGEFHFRGKWACPILARKMSRSVVLGVAATQIMTQHLRCD